MDRQVETYLKDCGYKIGTPQERKSTGTGPVFSEWFNTRVLGLDSESYRREFWHEAYTTGHTIGHVPRTLRTRMYEMGLRRSDERVAFLFELAILQGAAYPFWVLARLITKEVSRLRRSTYYDRERRRRWRLADERVAIRVRRTANPCPSLEEVRAAWNHVHTTRGHEHALAVLRCGALLEDLEGYVDNHAYTTRGVPGIRGRAPGIKGLFRDQAPDLFDAYKNVMRCKSLAKKYRQAVGCPDPVPTVAVLPVPIAPVLSASGSSDFVAERPGANLEGPGWMGMPRGADPWDGAMVEAEGIAFPLLPCLQDVDALAAWMRVHGNTAYLCTREWLKTPVIDYKISHLLPSGAQAEAVRILTFGSGSLVAVEAAIALRIDPQCVAADPGVRIKRLAGGRKAPSTPRRIRRWLAAAVGLRTRDGAAA